ncbi:MAG: autotransporter outer membrane beta-barrel domain-containing protein [Afipia felis]|nr:autotransporter outer membrane beta-barrel domain-containing protein [Afipia felis]
MLSGTAMPLRTLRRGFFVSTAFAGLLCASEAARAACTPAAANNVVATCTGSTIFYGGPSVTGITINVMPGAMVGELLFAEGTVVNSGSISRSSYAIDSQGDLSVTNFGLIEATSPSQSAISAVGNTTVVNSGKIIGDIHANGGPGSNGTLLNSGTLLGAVTFNAGTVVNSGSISTSDLAIWLISGPGTVTNTGSIIGSNGGIRSQSNLELNNSGTIQGSGYYGGVWVGQAASIVNSGTILGGMSFNITNGPQSDSLTVLPGAHFGGLVDFGGGADKVTFGPGNWILNTAQFDAALSTVTTAGTPHVVTLNQIVVADLSGFGAMNRAIMDITGWIASVLPDAPVYEPAPGGSGAANAFAAIEAAAPRDDYAFNSTAPAYAPVPAFKGGAVSDRDGNSVWAKAFGGRRDQSTEGGFIGSVTVGYGGAIGYDRQITPATRLGGFVGGSSNETQLALNAGGLDTGAVFGGLYARNMFGAHGATFLDLSLIGGRLDTKSTRNLGGGLAFETARASYDGWFVNPAVMLGHRFALANGYTLTPALKLRYVAAGFGGYTETGSSANLVVGARDLQAFEERAELTLANASLLDNGSRIGVRLNGGLLAQQRSGDANVNVTLIGQNFIAATPDKQSVLGLYGGAGLDWRFGRVALFAAGEIVAMNDSTTSVAGKGGVRVVW